VKAKEEKCSKQLLRRSVITWLHSLAQSERQTEYDTHRRHTKWSRCEEQDTIKQLPGVKAKEEKKQLNEQQERTS